jgi:hypothetical protein
VHIAGVAGVRFPHTGTARRMFEATWQGISLTFLRAHHSIPILHAARNRQWSGFALTGYLSAVMHAQRKLPPKSVATLA